MSDIVRAREILTRVAAELFSRDDNLALNIDEALRLMTRTVVKRNVRQGIEVTPAHVAAILAADRDNLTCAQIALQVFGNPCNLGTVSRILREGR